MCLRLRTKQEVNIAEEDIVCYKFLYTSDDGNLRTPFKGVIVHDFILKSELQAPYKAHPLFGFYQVSQGIHSMKSIDVATLFYRDWGWFICCDYEDLILYECVIPKGSKYYHNNGEYASDKLQILKTIEFDRSIANKYKAYADFVF